MFPDTRREETETTSHQDRIAPGGGAMHEGGQRQPQMSQPDARAAGRDQGVDAGHWLVPDTRDDIVVTRYE